MMDTVDYRSTPVHHMLQDMSPYHGQHQHQHHQQSQQQLGVGGGGTRLLQSPSPTADSYAPAGGSGVVAASAIDASYTTLQPLPPAAATDKFSAASTSAALLGSSTVSGGGGGGFAGFMDDMTLNPYHAAAAYKYDKLNGMQESCSPAVAAAFGGGSGYGMMHNGYGTYHQSSLASLYHHHPCTTGEYVSPNGFQLSAAAAHHHKSLMLDTKPPAGQMMSPGSSPAVAAYDPYSRGAGLLSVAATTGNTPSAAPSGAATALLLPPSAPSPLSAAYGNHHMFHHHHHHHHHGSPAASPSSRALHHPLSGGAVVGPHRSLHELRACGGSLRPSGCQPPTNGPSAGASHCHEMEEINTRDLAQKISSELKRYSIPQAVFAQRVLCRSQGTLSDLLRNPKPWSKLKSGRETFRRMWKWLQEPEYQRMSALRLAG